MIDIERDVVAEIVAALPDVLVVNNFVGNPAKFPHVSVVEADNYTYLRGEDSSNEEKYASVMYEVNIHTNDNRGKKSSAKNIFNTIDSLLRQMGFARIMATSQTENESTVYRIIARYTAVVSADKFLFRR